jgi:Zn-dependent peptidase ImmA (M78 family)
MSARSKQVRAAEDLLTKHRVISAPVEVENIARAEGIVVARNKLEPSVSGLLLRDGASSLITVNNSHHPKRQRFTVAHELGHFILHPGKPYLVDSTVRVNFRDDLASMATNREEIDANTFAAALLMPETLVRDAIGELRQAQLVDAARVVERLAAQFDVSTEAMGYRLINLGLAT